MGNGQIDKNSQTVIVNQPQDSGTTLENILKKAMKAIDNILTLKIQTCIYDGPLPLPADQNDTSEKFITIIESDGDITNYIPKSHADLKSAVYAYHVEMIKEAKQLYSERAQTIFTVIRGVKDLLTNEQNSA